MSKQQHDQGVKKKLARRRAASAKVAYERALWRSRRNGWLYDHGLTSEGPQDGR